jgi:hypothetical protein
MKTIILAFVLFLIPDQAVTNQISDAQKNEFIELLKTLPHKGEFFTEEAVKRAAPYLPVLFALTEKDIEAYDIYPFAAISRGLCDAKEHRRHASNHFAEIRHPMLKLFWAAMLFDSEDSSPEIARFLQDSLKSEHGAKTLAEIVGPNFEDFKRRVIAYQEQKK